MELRLLHTFRAAAERESFTRAAQQLQLTQAAVSQHIAALEKELGVALFHREGRGVQLSEAGKRLYPYAEQILALTQQARAEVNEQQPQLFGELQIASSTVPAEWLIPDLLAEFRARWPQVRESVVVSDSQVATNAVEAGDADLGFVGELPSSAKLEATPIIEDELTLFVSSRHPLASKGTTTIKQLCSEPLITREAGSGTRRCVEQALIDHDVSPGELTIAMEFNSNDAIRAAVKRGVGVAFLSKRTHLNVDGLTLIKVRGFRPIRDLYLISRLNKKHRPPADQFFAFLKEWRRGHSTQRG
ncbi:MAG: selenium metabolism-associated LysR family transcriptional regulator [Pirellulaceae bacterium]|nr:selenium metabolism-associated LysR family transcriptional regulator [Pirellulaceae bacterium]